MEIVSVLQRIMGGSLTAGFVAHDHYFIHKYMGINFYSLLLLFAIGSFHLMILLEKAGIVETVSDLEKRKVKQIRILVAAVTTLIAFVDCLNNININNESYFTLQNVLLTIFSILLVIFPDVVLKIIFIYRKKIR